MKHTPLSGQMIAEAIGSFTLVFFGTGSVAVAVLTGAHNGLWQVAMVWGFGIALAIYGVGAVSGAHINPAVTVSMAIYRRDEFPARKLLPYITAQMIGGMLASLVLLGLFGATCRHFEATHDPPIVRGEPGSQVSAMWFGEYFPNPAIYGTGPEAMQQVSATVAFAGEAIGTAFLVFFVLALTDHSNRLSPTQSRMHPFFIGFTVASVIAIVAPLTQAGLNPMRDFAPRLVAYFAGWGKIAIPGPRGVEWWLYILAPIVGGIAGGGVYHAGILPHLSVAKAATPDSAENEGASAPSAEAAAGGHE